MLHLFTIHNNEVPMKEWSILAVEVSMAVTGIMMMCLMAFTALH